MNIQEFASVMINHKTGFLLSTGDVGGDRNAPIETNSIYYDTASQPNKDTLKLSNNYHMKEVDGRKVESAYGMSYSAISLKSIESIKEHFDDSLSYVFETNTQRLFEIEVADERSDSGVYTIGLL